MYSTVYSVLSRVSVEKTSQATQAGFETHDLLLTNADVLNIDWSPVYILKDITLHILKDMDRLHAYHSRDLLGYVVQTCRRSDVMLQGGSRAS